MPIDRSTIECKQCSTVYKTREKPALCTRCGCFAFKPSRVILEGSFPRSITMVNGKPVYGPDEE